MSLKLLKKRRSETPTLPPPGGAKLRSSFLRLLSFATNTWEIALILLVAAFLRFYQINTTEFDDDQAKLYRMAYDAVHHGLLPITSNTASIGIAHPPGVIYLFMLVAALSANPLGGALLVSIFTTAAVLLTYFFTRRYYGRFAGFIAAILYATAPKPLNYARFIWQPNLMPPIVVLFMFALFWGVVERRKGWLFPALVLLGVLYQMHPITLLLAIPLLAAVVLAPGTLRWRDLALALAFLLVIFSPYLMWEVYTRFADVSAVFTLAKQHAHIDGQAIHFYHVFLSPYDKLPTDTHSVVFLLAPLLTWLYVAVPLLTLGGFVTAGVLLLRSRWSGVRSWWADLRADSYRCGLLLLLTWQIVPLLILSRHAVDLHSQYFFMFLPGPFILIGLCLAKAVAWFQARGGQWNILRYGMYVIASLVIIAQLVGSTAEIIDSSSGNFNDRGFYPYHNDFRSLQSALDEADQLAQQRRLNRVYVTTDIATQTALRYLAEQMHTPATLFDASNCLVLPNPADGPAVLLVGPYDGLTNALLSQFAAATLIDQPARLGGSPFRLYIVTPAATPTSSQNTFRGNLQMLGTQAQHLNYNGSSWLVTRWSLLRAEQPSYRTTYNYALRVLLNGNSEQSLCTFTSIRAGDQLLVTFGLPKNASIPALVTIKAQSFMTIPNNPFYGPFHMETDTDRSTVRIVLQTRDSKDSIALNT
ncbi:MAG: ArnT family glycosyltransferase [Ktedonobacteraceae bacterium]